MPRVTYALTVAGLATAAFVVGTWITPQAARSAVSDNGPRQSGATQPFVVHEWGTFTSFAGSDGVQLDFRPLLDEDLPGFVLSRERQAGARSALAKSALFAPLRMETPVTYFYVDEPREVRVKVQFPEGLLTEFYPPVRNMLPAYQPMLPSVRGPSELDWGTVMLIPQASLQPQLGDAALSAVLAERLMAGAPPSDNGYGHYGAARETDSALVAVNLPAAAKPTGKDIFSATLPPPSGLHVEKFLFYRGVGKFELPLQAQVDTSGRVQVTNTGTEPIQSLFLIDVQGPRHKLRILRSAHPAIAPAGTVTLELGKETLSLAELKQEVQQALVAEGLFEKEAAAMVKTWSNSWFREQGLRLFYMVPQSLTDRVLPLTVEPAPDEVIRVLVGRMELLPPDQEAEIAKAVRVYRLARETRSAKGGSEPPSIPNVIAELGRFAEPALVRVRELTKDQHDAAEAGRLIARLRDAN
ncbi:hypothetical protein GC163_00200 [bacterium]|nr:hypothetical protein [bacterium]